MRARCVAELADALDSKADATLGTVVSISSPLFRIRLMASDRLPAKKGWLLNRQRSLGRQIPHETSSGRIPGRVIGGGSKRTLKHVIWVLPLPDWHTIAGRIDALPIDFQSFGD
jgi:hypothetical protein